METITCFVYIYIYAGYFFTAAIPSRLVLVMNRYELSFTCNARDILHTPLVLQVFIRPAQPADTPATGVVLHSGEGR